MNVAIVSIAEYAISVVFGKTMQESYYVGISQLNQLLYKEPFEGFIETVPSYTTLTVFYAPQKINAGPLSPSEFVVQYVKTLLGKEKELTNFVADTIVVPVCYDEAFGYDLASLAEAKNISMQSLIQLHSEQEYKVYMMGFLPGFPYMGEVHPKLVAPRKASPRSVVAAGSVGIAGNQTGIYPLDSPGGWQIVGRTPLHLFDLNNDQIFYFKTGNRIRFEPISKSQFYALKKELSPTVTISNAKSNAIVLKPGVFAIFQDMGRQGYRAFGIPESGAMDITSHHLANAIVGNTMDAATIEVTMGGMAIQFLENTYVVVTGAGKAVVDAQTISYNKKQLVKAHSVLEIRFSDQGLRTYIAVEGGFETTILLNSRSATPKINIGSVLTKGAALYFGKKQAKPSRGFVNLTFPNFELSKTIRIIEGAEYDWLDPASKLILGSDTFHLSNRCDRMGYHLQGVPLKTKTIQELLSTAVVKGTIQLTPNGQLIVLMNDCQTTGGYPRVAQVAAVDMPILAQLRPTDDVSFKMISFIEAEKLYLNQQNKYEDYFN
jgi:antagonist of KipI